MAKALPRYLILVCLLATGCLVRPSNEVVDGPPNRIRAVQIIRSVLVDRGLPGFSTYSITWMSGDCLETPETDNCTTGLEYGGCEIYVLDRDKWYLSSAGHEFLHCSIGDGEHEWEDWWEVTRQMEDALESEGI